MKKNITWIALSVITIIYVQALFFKFSGSEETTILFNTLATWLNESLGLSRGLTDLVSAYGAYAVGSIELAIVGLIIIKKTRVFGAILNLGVISGAILTHLSTPVGIDRIVDAAGNTDGGALFFMACLVAVSTVCILFLGFKAKTVESEYTPKIVSI